MAGDETRENRARIGDQAPGGAEVDRITAADDRAGVDDGAAGRKLDANGAGRRCGDGAVIGESHAVALVPYTASPVSAAVVLVT